MRTYTGLEVDPLNLRPCDVSIQDIAHSLANTCRFNGHVQRHYSVAQHCVLVSRHCPSDIALEAVLHDAEETYTGDMIKDIKHHSDMDWFCLLGGGIQRTIFMRFGLVYTHELHDRIKESDNYICELEKKCLFRNSTSTVITPLPAEKAEREFLARFTELFRLRHAWAK